MTAHVLRSIWRRDRRNTRLSCQKKVWPTSLITLDTSGPIVHKEHVQLLQHLKASLQNHPSLPSQSLQMQPVVCREARPHVERPNIFVDPSCIHWQAAANPQKVSCTWGLGSLKPRNCGKIWGRHHIPESIWLRSNYAMKVTHHWRKRNWWNRGSLYLQLVGSKHFGSFVRPSSMSFLDLVNLYVTLLVHVSGHVSHYHAPPIWRLEMKTTDTYPYIHCTYHPTS